MLVTLLVLAVCVIGLWMLGTRDWDQPTVEEDAVIVRFGVASSDVGNRPLVIVRTKAGQVLQLNVNYQTTLYCRRGSMIRLRRQGATIAVDPRGCAPRAP